MADSDNPTVETLADGAHVTPADGGAAVVSDALSLSELNQALGKDFKDTASALKAFKDTFSYVGMKKEDIEAEIRKNSVSSPNADPALQSQVQQLSKELFYTQNPQYKEYRSLIDSMGGNPAEIVGTDVFKGVFEKVQAADEEAQKKSVLNSSPRLAQTKSHVDEAVKMANSTAGNSDIAEFLARGILEEAQG